MFTEAEQKIIDLIILDYTNKQIADKLGLSINTVKHHLTIIYKKTQTKSRYELKEFFDKFH